MHSHSMDARLAIGVIGNLKCHKSVFMVFDYIKDSSCLLTRWT